MAFIFFDTGVVRMKFSDMPYERPDPVVLKAEFEARISALKTADSFETADAAFLAYDKFYRHVDTLYNLVSIRHSIDTRDRFYDDEATFWDQLLPELQEYEQMWTQVLLASPFRREFEKKYGSVIFTNAEISLRTFSPAVIPMLQKENELVQEYEKLIASAQIPFRGGVYTISQLAPFKRDADDSLRLAAWQAEGGWYTENGAQLDRIYDDLVKLRHQIAVSLGYENFVKLGYDRMVRNCYDAADVSRFRAAVIAYLVPVASEIYRAQSKRLGKEYPMNFADNALAFRSGNAKPQGTAEDIVGAAKRFYHALSPETAEFIDVMLRNGLMDLLSTPGKEAGGYCTSLEDYEVPFIFANFNGTSGDVETVTHEAGHAFAQWMNRSRIPYSTVWPSLEGCEVHSMSMEFFAWRSADDFFGADARKFYYAHLADAITFIPYGTMVDHFQHIVYEHPEYTPAERHAEWKRLLRIYMPWMQLGGEIPFYGTAHGWQRQTHIYSSPFYYIDYCLAQTVALEFWAMLQKDAASAWEKYMAYTKLGGSDVFVNLLKKAGLQSPFDADCLMGVCKTAHAWLEAYDLSGIA